MRRPPRASGLDTADKTVLFKQGSEIFATKQSNNRPTEISCRRGQFLKYLHHTFTTFERNKKVIVVISRYHIAGDIQLTQ